jgi:hypothetical protein
VPSKTDGRHFRQLLTEHNPLWSPGDRKATEPSSGPSFYAEVTRLPTADIKSFDGVIVCPRTQHRNAVD